MRFHRDVIATAPDELNGFLALMKVPPVHPYPPALHGQAVCGIVWCHVGSAEDAARASGPVRSAVPPMVDRGDTDAAGRAFIDCWMGAGAWDATPEVRRAAMAGSMRKVRGWAGALFGEQAAAGDLALLRMPILLLGGQHSAASAREVLRLLARAWPQAQRRRWCRESATRGR